MEVTSSVLSIPANDEYMVKAQFAIPPQEGHIALSRAESRDGSVDLSRLVPGLQLLAAILLKKHVRLHDQTEYAIAGPIEPTGFAFEAVSQAEDSELLEVTVWFTVYDFGTYRRNRLIKLVQDAIDIAFEEAEEVIH